MCSCFGNDWTGHRRPGRANLPDKRKFSVQSVLFKNGSSIIEDRKPSILYPACWRMFSRVNKVWMKSGKSKSSSLFFKTRFLPLFLVMVQVALGVFTVLTSINIRVAKWNSFEWMAQLHQFVGLLLLLSLVLAAFLLRKKSIYG